LWREWIQTSINKSHKILLIQQQHQQQQQLKLSITSLKLNRIELILSRPIKKVYHLAVRHKKINPQRRIESLTQKIKFSHTSSAKSATRI
jgi:hypothetical protein